MVTLHRPAIPTATPRLRSNQRSCRHAGVKDAAVRWRTARQRTTLRTDRSASRVTRHRFFGHNSLLCCSEPGSRMGRRARRETAGTRCRGSCAAGFGNGEARNITAVVSGELSSKALPQARRNEHRKQCRCFMTAVPNEARLISAGSLRLLTLTATRYAQRANEVRFTIRVSPMFQRSERSEAVLAHGHCLCRGAVRDCCALVGGRTQAERSEVQWS
jgi:hypothetical protein